MAAEDPPNVFERTGRTQKAMKLSRYLIDNGVSLEIASSWVDWQWEMWADEAGLSRPPSEKTQGMVLGMLGGHERRFRFR